MVRWPQKQPHHISGEHGEGCKQGLECRCKRARGIPASRPGRQGTRSFPHCQGLKQHPTEPGTSPRTSCPGRAPSSVCSATPSQTGPAVATAPCSKPHRCAARFFLFVLHCTHPPRCVFVCRISQHSLLVSVDAQAAVERMLFIGGYQAGTSDLFCSIITVWSHLLSNAYAGAPGADSWLDTVAVGRGLQTHMRMDAVRFERARADARPRLRLRHDRPRRPTAPPLLARRPRPRIHDARASPPPIPLFFTHSAEGVGFKGS